MLIIEARNVNYALSAGVDLVHRIGVRQPSRNGDVLRVKVPVTTVYDRPTERVLLHNWRDANPFFHLVEAMWMLAGRNDLKSLTGYVKNMANYSDDGGKTQPAAYGHRWRDHFTTVGDEGGFFPSLDQLDWAVKRLQADPGDRRVVIQMWDGSHDPWMADQGSKDVPCNLTALPWALDGKLNLTVFNRSNDMYWGAYGANAVHFSVLLEYLAGRVGLSVGTYTQISNNFHHYVSNETDPQACWTNWPGGVDPYAYGTVEPFPLFSGWSSDVSDRILREDLAVFFDHGWQEAVTKARWPFLRRVVAPMAAAHAHWKTHRGQDRYEGALEILNQVQASDWRLAAQQWIMKRYLAWSRAADDGVQHG